MGIILKNLYEEIYPKMLQINQKGILKFVQVTHRKAGERREIKNRKKKKKPKTNKKKGKLKPLYISSYVKCKWPVIPFV